MSFRFSTLTSALSLPLCLCARLLLSGSPCTCFAICPLLFGITLGCGGSPSGPPLVPAEGLITLDDRPLTGATILLIPQGDTLGQAGVATTDASGKFAVTTTDQANPGVAVGSYKVVISKKVNPDGTDFRPAPDQDPMLAAYKEVLPPIYHDEAQSRLTAEILPGGKKDLEFKLKSKAK